MLAHQRPVDLIYLKVDEDERWALIKAVEPDVLVLTEDHSYTQEEQARLAELCGGVAVLERQASVTTSERIRQLYMHLGERLGPKLAEVLPGLIDSMLRRAWRAALAPSFRCSTRATGAFSSATRPAGPFT